MENYYKEQAGSGLGGYSGVRYQKGHGWFGRIISGGIVPILRRVLPYLGKRALETGVGVATDIMDGENFKSSAKKRFKSIGKRVEEDTISKVKQMTGGGYRKKRRKKASRIMNFGLKMNKRRMSRVKSKQKLKTKPKRKSKRKVKKRKKSRKKVSFL